jgi:hypothetical protein
MQDLIIDFNPSMAVEMLETSKEPSGWRQNYIYKENEKTNKIYKFVPISQIIKRYE